MSKIYDELVALIESQQKGKENTDVFMVGEQLKDMSAESDYNAEILLQDIAMKEMNLVAAAAKLKDYADKNHKGAKCFCITPNVACAILREFYGLQREEYPIVIEPMAWTERAPAEAIAKEAADKLLDAQKKLKMASPSVTEFKALFNQVQGTVQKMRALIEVVRGEDAATAERLTAALKAFGGSL